MTLSAALPPLESLLSLGGKTAVVTGAGQGFGAAISRRLAEAGAFVVLADQKGEQVAALAEELRGAGWEAAARQTDVSDGEQVAELMAFASGQTSRLGILVNNAGVFSNFLLAHMPVEEFERIMKVNVTGAFLCTQAAADLMSQDGQGGVVVNIASVDAMHPSAEGLVHYTTSKHAIAGLTRTLAMELAPSGVRINAVCPGASMTEGAIELVTAGAPEGIDVEAQWDGIKDRTPMGRLCDPDDVARAVLFLASDLAEFVTGILLPVDGGILIQPLEGYVHASTTTGTGDDS